MQICLNGSFFSSTQPVFPVTSRAFRYGDGIFETMLCRNGAIPFFNLHMNRLFKGMDLLGYKCSFNKEMLRDNISLLCLKNKCDSLARVRLTVFGGEGNLSEPREHVGYVIEATVMDPEMTRYNSRGLHIGVYSGMHKSCDAYANLKSTSALAYVMAAQYARELQWDDCLVLNTKAKIADSSIANLFIIKGSQIITPALSEGGVDGVMRRALLEKFSSLDISKKFRLIEGSLGPGDLEDADEVFLTNAVRGIQWVRMFNQVSYSNRISKDLSASLLQTI